MTQKSPIPDNMSGNWQHKILQFDIPPPEEVWTKIADQLDEEYHQEDILISQKMHDFEIIPPAFILDRVLEGVVPVQSQKSPASVFSFPLKRVAIAAVAVGLIVITLIYFVRPGSTTGTENSTANIIPPTPGSSSIAPSETDKENNAEPNAPSDPEMASLNRPSKKTGQLNNNITRKDRNVKYVSLNPVLAANAISPISVSAPPIYDGNGNIIMDENLVSAPDENYIIVTSPNGEQTKISRKFLKMLCVMNGGTDNNYMNAENFEWKLRFEEWRSKLLQQASYIPTANNFLDIMDLKELLQEN